MNYHYHLHSRFSSGTNEIMGNIRSERSLLGKDSDEIVVCHLPHWVQFHITILPQDQYR